MAECKTEHDCIGCYDTGQVLTHVDNGFMCWKPCPACATITGARIKFRDGGVVPRGETVAWGEGGMVVSPLRGVI